MTSPNFFFLRTEGYTPTDDEVKRLIDAGLISRLSTLVLAVPTGHLHRVNSLFTKLFLEEKTRAIISQMRDGQTYLDCLKIQLDRAKRIDPYQPIKVIIPAENFSLLKGGNDLLEVARLTMRYNADVIASGFKEDVSRVFSAKF